MNTTVIDSPPAYAIGLVPLIDHYLDKRLAAVDLPDRLKSAVRYAVLSGGKRLRPVLVLLTCEACGGERVDALPSAAAMELIHCFSLVHDDLPAMDDDDLRRGRPTLHVHDCEAIAILAGDVMVSLACEFVADCNVPAALRTSILKELCGSTTRMIAGQVLDTLGGFPEDMEPAGKLEQIHCNKTGALIRASCRIGALCAEADQEQVDAADAYGTAVGLMFQIVDDVLDVTQSEEHLGKASGKDQVAGKLTAPGVLGLERSRRKIEELRERAHEAAQALGQQARPLIELCDYLAVRTR